MITEYIAPNTQLEQEFWEFVTTVPEPWRSNTRTASFARTIMENPDHDEYWKVFAHDFVFRILVDQGNGFDWSINEYKIIQHQIIGACSNDERLMSLVGGIKSIHQKTETRLYCILSDVITMEDTITNQNTFITGIHQQLTIRRISTTCAYECCLDLATPLTRLNGIPLCQRMATDIFAFPSNACIRALSEMGIKGPTSTLCRAMRNMRDQSTKRAGARFTLPDIERLLSLFWLTYNTKGVANVYY